MTIRQWISSFAACATLVTATAVTQANTTIDTASGWNGLDQIGLFGEDAASIWGQTVTVDNADTSLDSFSFWVNDQNSFAPVNFAAYVVAWDDTNQVATGPVLYQSATQTTTQIDAFEMFTFNTGGLNLTQGQQYILLLSAADFFDSQADSAFLGDSNGDNYAGGTAYLLPAAGNNFAAIYSAGWVPPGNTDLVFIANFSGTPTPEPASMALLVMGAGVIGLAVRRRTH